MKEIVKKQDTDIVIKKEQGVALFEDAFADSDDMLIMPVAKVMQPTSELLQDEDYDFRQGDIVNSLLAEKLPEKFVPITWHQANIFFLPKNDAEKKKIIKDFNLPEDFDEMFVCRSQNGRDVSSTRIGKTSCMDCQLNKFGWDGNPDTPPICTNSMNFLALFEGQEAPVVIQFANTSRTEGKKLYSLIKYSGTAKNPWERMYSLVSRKQSNDKGVFFVLKVKPSGRPDEELKEFAFALAKDFSGKDFIIDEGAAVQEEMFSDAEEI